MVEQLMTVLQFTEQHLAAGCATQESIQAHIDGMVRVFALTEAEDHRTYRVVTDSEGRSSTVWLLAPASHWERLLQESIKVAAMLRLIEMIL